MKIPTLGKIKIPVFGVGTWKMGGFYIFRGDKNDNRDLQALKAALDLGVTHIDTAEMYGHGHAEELVGWAIKDRDRKKLFITSKVQPLHFKYDSVIKACQGSLKRLGTDYLNLYLLHWPNPLISLSETIGALDQLVKDGLVKHIGVSNFSVDQLKQAQKLSKNTIVTNQVEYSLSSLDPEADGTLKYCQENGVILTAYSPLGQGSLVKSGTNKVLDEICQKYNKAPSQVALNYLISHKNVIVIPKASNVDHLRENLGCLGWKLEAEDLKKLKSTFS